MSSIDARTAALDTVSAERLERGALRMSLVDTADAAAFATWLQADIRGFHGGRIGEDMIRRMVEQTADRRTTGVFDDGYRRDEPVATAQSWVSDLTVPGERSVPAWAISSITVAPTHRRRGIARAMLEAELHTAAAAGVPIAMLTVSEATIYGRYGFAPAAQVTEWSVETKRVRWTGGDVTGSVRFIDIPAARRELAELHERTRLQRPGDIEVWDLRWDQIAGIADEDEARSKALRAVDYTDETGSVRGIAIYRVRGGDDDFTKHSADVEHLITDGAEAYTALWRYLLELDLVTELTAGLRSTDEPLWWMIGDHRAAKVRSRDHQWLRIVDPIAALGARRWSRAGRYGLQIVDPLGLAAGRFVLSVDEEGLGTAVAAGELPDGIPAIEFPIDALSAVYLGGNRVATLAAAGRLRELAPGSADAFDAALRSPRTPTLTIWY